MGCVISKSTIYNRNELLYANRMANKYGITYSRYNEFIKNSEYELVMLHFNTLEGDKVDASYVHAWNNWKHNQSWSTRYDELDTNLLVYLSKMPTKLNGWHNVYRIPTKHTEYMIESLTKFYTMHGIPDKGDTTIEAYVTNRLDSEYYENIVKNIQTTYNLTDWEISQNMNIEWLRMIYYIRNSSFRHMNDLNYIENLCQTQKNIVYDSLNNKIMI